MTKHLSREYLEEAFTIARQHLPGWVFAVIHTEARARAGGRAAHRVDEPTLIEKLALTEIRPRTLKALSDVDLRAVWLRLHQWFANAKKRKEAIEDIVNAALFARDEMQRRDFKIEVSELTAEINKLQTRKAEVLGKRGELPAQLEALLEDQPSEIMLVRDFVSVVGSAAVTEKPNDIDIAINAKTEGDSFVLDGAALFVALRRFLDPEKSGKIQFLDSPHGSHSDHVPIFDLVARKREPSVQRVEMEPAKYEGQDRVVKENKPELAAGLNITIGPRDAPVVFVGASPSPMDVARREPFTGAAGRALNEHYLEPLGLTRRDVALANVGGDLGAGIVVALGKEAHAALGDTADMMLPHPSAVARLGVPQSLRRKLKALKKRLAKQEGEDTRGEKAQEVWIDTWQDQLPTSGMGRYVVQHHWRGLTEEETKLSDEELLKTSRSLHTDLRLEGDDALWGAAVLVGRAQDNVPRDKLLALKMGDPKNLQLAIKLPQPKAWLDVGRRAPKIVKPGGVGATSNKFAKFFALDWGTYKTGVGRQHSVEIFLSSEKLKERGLSGRYLFNFAPGPSGRRWIIDRPTEQTPTAEREGTPDFRIRDIRAKGQKFLIFGKPGEKPQKIDVRTGKVVKEITVAIAKADEEKRIIYGVVLDPYQVDSENDWTPTGQIEDTAHEWMKTSRVIGFQHKQKADAHPVESWVVQYPSPEDYKKAVHGEAHRAYKMPFGSDTVHSGAWIVGTKLGKKEWALFKSGEIDAYSIGGFGHRTSIQRDTMPEVEFIELAETR